MNRRRFLLNSVALSVGSLLAWIGLREPALTVAASTHKQLKYIVPYNGTPTYPDWYFYAAQIAREAKLRPGTSERFFLRYRGSDGSLYWKPVDVLKYPNRRNLVEFYEGNYREFEDGEYL